LADPALDSCQTVFKITWVCDLILHLYGRQPGAVLSAEHPPAWEQIPVPLSSRVKGVHSPTGGVTVTLECPRCEFLERCISQFPRKKIKLKYIAFPNSIKKIRKLN
jgi:hypothetical protein